MIDLAAKHALPLVIALLSGLGAAATWIANQAADIPEAVKWLLGPTGLLIGQMIVVIYLVRRMEMSETKHEKIREDDRKTLMGILKEQTQINAECRDVMREHARLTESNNKVLSEVQKILE